MSSELQSIVAAVKSSTRIGVGAGRGTPGSAAKPFVTISRQAGIPGSSLAHALARGLSEVDPGERDWETFERELVEKVAAEHRVPPALVQHFENSSQTWLADLVEGIQFSNEPGEETLHRHVSATILALARAGRVVLVGRGAILLTTHMPGGIHVGLTAPLEHRVALLAKNESVSHDEALRRVQDIQNSRHAFFKRHWPRATVGPELFTISLNVAAMDEQEMVALVSSLVLHRLCVAKGQH